MKLAYFKAIYSSLIDGAARDTGRINELEAKLKVAVEIIEELQSMDGVPHLDHHFEFIAALSKIKNEDV